MTRPRHKNTSDKIEREMKSKPNQINTLKKKKKAVKQVVA